MSHPLDSVALPVDVRATLDACANIVIPATRAELYQLALGPDGGPRFVVEYDVNGTRVPEADVVRCKNGIAVNYPEDYMRRRDPDCMRIADDIPTDKTRSSDVLGADGGAGLRVGGGNEAGTGAASRPSPSG